MKMQKGFTLIELMIATAIIVIIAAIAIPAYQEHQKKLRSQYSATPLRTPVISSVIAPDPVPVVTTTSNQILPPELPVPATAATGPNLNDDFICLEGYKFVSTSIGKTQILSQSGGGVPCVAQ